MRAVARKIEIRQTEDQNAANRNQQTIEDEQLQIILNSTPNEIDQFLESIRNNDEIPLLRNAVIRLQNQISNGQTVLSFFQEENLPIITRFLETYEVLLTRINSIQRYLELSDYEMLEEVFDIFVNDNYRDFYNLIQQYRQTIRNDPDNLRQIDKLLNYYMAAFDRRALIMDNSIDQNRLQELLTIFDSTPQNFQVYLEDNDWFVRRIDMNLLVNAYQNNVIRQQPSRDK
jgi:dGTP triphosphohydrolase